MKHSLRALTAKFYAYGFFDDFILIYPLYTLLFADSGVSPTQIAILLIVWSAVSLVLEVPSGAIADKFSRKNVLVAAVIIRLVGFSLWIAFPTFWGFLAGFVLWGINSALASGTEEALLYDELTRLNKQNMYAKSKGRFDAIKLTATVAASAGAGLFASLGFDYTFLIICGIIACALSAIAVAMLPASKAIETTGETGYLAILKTGVLEAFTKPFIALLVVFSSLLIGIGAFDEYYNLLFREQGLSNAEISFWLAAIGVVGVGGSLLAHKLENKKISMEVFLVGMAALILLASILKGAWSAIAIAGFVALHYGGKVLFSAHLQHTLSDKTRATTTSVSGFLSEFVAIIFVAFFGLSAETHGYGFGFMVSGIAILVSAGAFWLFARVINKKRLVQEVQL